MSIIRVLLYLFLLLSILLIGISVWQMMAYKVPQPNYQVVKQDGDIEIRQYSALLVAEVTVEGERYAAINHGFRQLADFIFGNNNRNEKIAMTAPVLQQLAIDTKNDSSTWTNTNNQWTVRFIMPPQFTRQNLPVPHNAKVTFIEIPARKYVVITFKGFNTTSNLQEHMASLLSYCQLHHLQTKGNPLFAFYNPPWILPFLRRNEIMIEIAGQ